MCLLLTDSDVEACLSMERAIDIVQTAYQLLSSGAVTMPQRAITHAAAHEGVHLCMPAYVAFDPLMLGVKVIAVYPHNVTRHGLPVVQGAVLLHDPQNGKMLAIIAAGRLTALRTGAAGGVAARLFARPDAREASVFGAGVQARAQLEALATVRPLAKVTVWSRSDDRKLEFCRHMAEKLRLEVSPAESAEQAARSADVIVTATNSPTPVLCGEWLRPGTHITAIGAFGRDTRELDTDTIRKAKLYVDNRAAALIEAGDVLIPLQEGAIAPDHIVGEIGDVLTGRAPGRVRAEEITVFKSVGLAVQDLMTAHYVYERAIEMKLGSMVSLH